MGTGKALQDCAYPEICAICAGSALGYGSSDAGADGRHVRPTRKYILL